MLGRTWVSLTRIDVKATARNLVIPFSFILPTLILYSLNPKSFETVWIGRAPLLFFSWLFLLELILGWKKLLNGRIRWTWFRIVAVIVAAAAPTIYVISTSFLGLDHSVWWLGKLLGAPDPWPHWHISLEYLLFTAFLTASVLLTYGIEGLKRFSISLFFLGATGFFYTLDTFYPFGTVHTRVLQAFAPVTASSVVRVLNWMGYEAQLAPYKYMGMPVLFSPRLPPLAIGWPCAGVHSLFIYTFVILFFLRDAEFSLERKIIYVAVGAIGTFIINVLRIVTICIIGINVGREAMNMFHNYYGELFFIAWIIAYPLTIIYGRKIWAKLSIFGVKLIETGRRFLKVTEH